MSEKITIGVFDHENLSEESQSLKKFVMDMVRLALPEDNMTAIPLVSLDTEPAKEVDILVIREEMAPSILNEIAKKNLGALRLLVVSKNGPFMDDSERATQKKQLNLREGDQVISLSDYANGSLLDIFRYFFRQPETA